MRIFRLLPGLGLRIARHKRGDQVSARVRRVLVETLYTQPTSLAIGALMGIVASAVTAIVSGVPQLWIGFVLLSVVSAMRVALGVRLAPAITGPETSRTETGRAGSGRADTRQANTRQADTRHTGAKRASTLELELLYEVGAFTYALALGMVAAMTLWFPQATEAQALMVSGALCYGVGAAARNAGRPTIAIGQLALVSLPIAVAALLVGTLASIALLAAIALLAPAVISITLNLFHILRNSITAAETSAQLAEKMQRAARTDVVTGLANRAGLNHAMIEAMMVCEEDTRCALFWIDLDRFKEVNDLLGHPVGDRVLAEVAQRLREVCPPAATVARFGGDEFVIFSPISDRKEAVRLASEMHAEIMRPIQVESDRLEVRASLGVALLPEDGVDADTLMQRADLALYHAKVRGRSQTCFFDHVMTRDLVRRREIEGELRTAIQREELTIFFQPIIDLETGRIRSFEALVRWFHPEKGELKPDEFIPVAEETGVIITLGNWITAQAARIAAQWPEDVTVSVNLSPLQIRAPGAALGIRNALREAGLDPHRLELEVTESLFVEDNYATASFIEELTEIGVQFALDDFGTGYSSLGYINSFPFTKIKVDRSFVSGAQVGRRSDAIIRAVAEMGARLEMEIVAEGLETIEQVQAVRAAGCTLGQGFYFSRPVPDYLAAMLLAKERDIETERGALLSASR